MTRQDTSTLKISPRDLHAIWFLVKDGHAPAKENIESFGKEKFNAANKKDILALISKAIFLELLEETTKGWTLTSRGREFSELQHWKYWRPKGTVLDKVRSLGLEQTLFAVPLEERPIVIDLFSGVGGLSLGFEAAGFNIGLSIDNDREACDAHRKNFPWGVVKHEGVETIASNPKVYISKIPELKGRKIAGVVGGPPCQGFSNIGERADGDERNLLTSRFMDVVLGIEPDFFLMENVPGLATSGIPPKLSIYLARQAKSIGEPAAAIVSVLPKAPNSLAKRDRQYKKRFVSATVSEFKAVISKKKKIDELSKRPIPAAVAESFDVLSQLFVERIVELYGNTLTRTEVNKTLDSAREFLAEIALSSTLEMLLKQALIVEQSCTKLLEAVAADKRINSSLKKSAQKILAKYKSVPEIKHLAGKKIGPVLHHLIERASEKYIIADPTVFNAAEFGVPQSRSRLFILGFHKRLHEQPILPKATHDLKGINKKLLPVKAVRSAISDLPDIDGYQHLIEGHELPFSELKKEASDSYAQHMRLDVMPTWDKSLPRPSWNPFVVDCCNRTLHAQHVVERLRKTAHGVQDETSHKTRLHPERPSCTLRAGTREAKGSHTAVRPVHYEYHRVLSVREGARIMGYPDWMTFHKTKWHGFRLVGNGVPFHLARAIAAQAFKMLYAPEAESVGPEESRLIPSRAA